jgi:hypothetical protein
VTVPSQLQADEVAAAKMLLALAAVTPDRRLDTLALVMKAVIEGQLPRFEDVLRRRPSAPEGLS